MNKLTKWLLLALTLAAIVGGILGWFAYGWLNPRAKVTDIQDGNLHGVHIQPATGELAPGVVAEIIGSVDLPDITEQGTLLQAPQGVQTGGQGNYTTTGNQTVPSPSYAPNLPYYQWGFKARGGGKFDTTGKIEFNPWSLPLTIKAYEDGSYDLLTTEPNVSFTVKSAVKAPEKNHAYLSAHALYNGSQWGAEAYYQPFSKGFLGGLEFGGGYLQTPFVGAGLRVRLW